MSAAPTKYVRTISFTAFSQSNPDQQQSGASIDTELNNLKSTTDQTIDRLAEIQRGDGALANLVVTPDSLSTETKALITAGGVPKGAWLTTTAYVAKDLITQAGITYICVTAHTAGVFATDLAAGKWMIFAQPAYNQSLNTSDSPTFASLTLTAALNVAGVSKFADGSAAAPSVTFSSDLDTGFYRVGANQLGVACNGANVGAFSSSGLVLGQTVYSRGEITPAVGTNQQLQALAAYLKSLIVIGWNGGSGFALCSVNASGGVTVIASSNASGGDNCFDTVNGAGSNGGNGISFFQAGGFMYIQFKTNYTAGAVTIHKFGG